MEEERNHVSRDHLSCAAMCCGSCAAISLLAGAIAYYVFGIIYLVHDFGLSDKCNNSHLWEYVLTSLILSLINIKINSNKEEDSGIFVIILVIIGVVNLCMSLWGGIELWDYSCNEINDSGLWKFGLAAFCVQVFCAFLAIVMPIWLLWYFYCCVERNEINRQENTNLDDINSNLKISTNI